MNSEKDISSMTFGIIGLGIMGGSIAKSIRTNILSSSGGKIFGLDKNEESLKNAVSSNIIDRGFSISESVDMLKLCDFVFICLYPKATVSFLCEHKLHFKDNAIITDISGVKNLIASKYEELCPPNAEIILGHPMAGGEKEGFSASKSEYFINHNYLLITKGFKNKISESNIKLFKEIIYKMGFSKITETDWETHDDKIGFTSQLCHVVASAMVESAKDPEITSFGGGSFEDLTRIAMINAPLWTELFLSNKEKLINHIEVFKDSINQIEEYIKNDDSENLTKLLCDVRAKRIEMNK